MSIERKLADLLRADNPARALADAREAPSTPPELRDALKHVSQDGLAIAALLVARLRFERLVQGSDRAARWFEADPAGFSVTFREYHRHVPPTAHFPPGEARLFEQFLVRPRP